VKSEEETATRFMMPVKSAENSGPPPNVLMDAIGKMAEGATEAGRMIQSGGLAPTAMSSRVRLSRGRLTTTDGPFAESKEVIGGFAVFEFKPREEAIESAVNFMELHKQHWPQAGTARPGFARSSRRKTAPLVTASSSWRARHAVVKG
jgi:hypothetical protein